MSKTEKFAVSESRRLLGNPYAHVEYLEDCGPGSDLELASASIDKRIQESRRLFQDPYAYLNDTGGYSALGNSKRSTRQQPTRTLSTSTTTDSGTSTEVKRRYLDREIETVTKELHARLWREKASLWDGIAPTDPIELLDPEMALRLVGYEYLLEEGLGTSHGTGKRIEVAGLIDRASKTVHISGQFPLNVQLFTAAHELGHAMLHQAGGGVHRDRPLDGAILSREPSEREADKFASYFLMPEKLVRTRFTALFGTAFFELDDDTAFALSGATVEAIQAKFRTRRDLSRLLASVERYHGRHFISLAAQFRVSIESMAIRLEELALFA